MTNWLPGTGISAWSRRRSEVCDTTAAASPAESAPGRRTAAVRAYWEAQPCGTTTAGVSGQAGMSEAWFAAVERERYRAEPFVHSVAQFTRWSGKKVLEIGVGAGADHLQFARAGADLSGVDLTDAAIQITRAHLAAHRLHSDLRRADAEHLPFDDASFDLVYSWGVIHHAPHPELVISEIHRVLRPGGTFLGMLYARHSVVTLKLWARHGLMEGHPLTPFDRLVAAHMESPGTKAYTETEVRKLFAAFSSCSTHRIATEWDRSRLPRRLGALLPDAVGWFIAIEATR
jgi:ubiquinone/menaquinone biosynthesis C-methylase UbiE